MTAPASQALDLAEQNRALHEEMARLTSERDLWKTTAECHCVVIEDHLAEIARLRTRVERFEKAWAYFPDAIPPMFVPDEIRLALFAEPEGQP